MEFTAKCPKCNKDNYFVVSDEEIANDYDFTCDECGKQSTLSEYCYTRKLK